MTAHREENPTNEVRLDSWKEIAAYLQRDVTTAIRWEKKEGLPVHRHRHRTRSSVYAYPSELDAWRDGRRPTEVEPWWWKWRRPVPAFASTIALAVVVLTAGSGPEVGAAQGAEPSFQRIEIPTGLNSGAAVSPDGSTVAFVSGGEIWTVPVHGEVSPEIAGQPAKLTEGAEALQYGLTWSGNAQWIAFNRNFREGSSSSEIYLVSALGGTPIKVHLPEPIDRRGHPCNLNLALSHDGRFLAFTSIQDGVLKLFQAQVESGKASPITGHTSREPAYSPDGERLAYIKLTGDLAVGRGEVRVLSLDSGTDTLVTEIPVRARSPIWSPDGANLAFLLEPQDNASKEMWVVPVAKSGAATAQPVMTQLPEYSIYPLAGWTQDDQIGMLLTSERKVGVYTLPVEGGMATKVTPGGVELSDPTWTPDGTRLLMRYEAGELAYVPSGGGQPAELTIEANPSIVVASPGGGNQISPDGQRIAVAAGNMTERVAHIWTLPADGGEATQLTSGQLHDRYPAWSPDGKTIAFVRRTAGSGADAVFNVCSLPSTGGEIRQLTRDSDNVTYYSSVAWSPDGHSLAVFANDGKLKVVPFGGGPLRVVTELPGLQPARHVVWTADGQTLLFSANLKIYKVPVYGGEPVEIKTGLDASILHLSLSHDNKRLAFTGYEGGQLEFWLVEDFLGSSGSVE